MKNKIAAIITAAGSSSRLGGKIKKEFLSCKDGTVLSECVKKIVLYSEPSLLAITYPKGLLSEAENAVFADKEFSQNLKDLISNQKLLIQFVEGSDTRQKSVYNALKWLEDFILKTEKTDFPSWTVLIHDGARPFVSEKIIKDVVSSSLKFGSASPGIMPVDTQKLIDSDGFIVNHLKRTQMVSVQTPQGFNLSSIIKAHENALKDGFECTDDTEIWGKYIGKVKIVSGDEKNIKITYPKDLISL